jgi:zinc protease
MGMLYPAGHPYARLTIGNRESIARITRDDLGAFHAAWFGASGALVSVVGAANGDLVRSRVARWFAGRGPGMPPPQPELNVHPKSDAGRAEFHMPHKSQVDIIMACPGVPRVHPDFYPLWLVNVILGGFGLMGRLGERIREEHGIAYHVSCRSNSRRWAGEWLAGAGVAPANVELALAGIREEVERARTELVSEEELEDAKAYLIGSAPLRLESNDGIAAYLLTVESYGLGLDYLERSPGYIRAQTREALREAARNYMDPQHACMAIAGPI